MVLGSLLLEPQMLGHLREINPRRAFADDLFGVLSQALTSPEQLASVAPCFERAFAGMADGLRARVESNLSRALDEVRALLVEVTGDFATVAQRINELETLEQGFELVSSLLAKAGSLLAAISETTLRDLIRRIHGLLVGTLGLDQGFLRDELRNAFRRFRQELLTGVDALSAKLANVRYALAALLGRAESELFAQLPTFDFNPDRLAQRAMQALEELGFPALQAKLGCVLDKLRAALTAGAGIAALAGPSPFGAGSVGAAAPRAPVSGDTYLWYASWLFRSRRRKIDHISWWGGKLFPGQPNDEVWQSQDKKQLYLRRVWADDVMLHEADAPFEWQDVPLAIAGGGEERFSFRADAQKMEILTKVLEATAELGKGIAHIVLFATGQKEYAANIPLWLWNWANSAFAFVSLGANNPPLAAMAANAAGQPVFFEWLFAWVSALSVLFGSTEGTYSKANGGSSFKYWISLVAGDGLSALKVSIGARIVKDVILEIATLINNTSHGDPTPTRVRNFEYSDGMVEAWGFLTDWLLTKYVVQREDYGYPCINAWYALYTLVAAPLSGVVAAMLGTFSGWAFAVTYDWGQLGINIGGSAFKSALLYSIGITQYLGMEGDTDGGKYNSRRKPDGTDHSPARQPFVGYPDAAASPYVLPWEAGGAKYVVQGNQGMFSHMSLDGTQSVYAYDFGFDAGDEVLAAREGVVEDFYDWIPDDTNPDDTARASARSQSDTDMGSATWRNDSPYENHIVIRHTTVDPVHDKSQGGATVTTFAHYVHGKKQSIRDVFAARGIAPANIIGSAVQQGQVIMKAGDTGHSFHDHLHIDVRTGRDQSLSFFTLPFVFRGVGVPSSLHWYTSSTVKVP